MRLLLVSGFIACVIGTALPPAATTRSTQATLHLALPPGVAEGPYRACIASVEGRGGPRVAITTLDAGAGALRRTLESDRPPDVVLTTPALAGELGSEDLLLPLTGELRRHSLDRTRFFSAAVDVWRGPDGERYAVPVEANTFALAVNRRLLQRAGVTPAEVRRVAWAPGLRYRGLGRVFGRHEHLLWRIRTATGAFALVLGTDRTTATESWEGLAASAGFHGGIDSAWGTRFRLDVPPLLATLSWWHREAVRRRRYVAAPDAAEDDGIFRLYATGSAAMTAISSADAARFAAANPSTEFVPLPTGPEGRRSSMLALVGAAVATRSENQPAASDLVRVLISTDCQARLAGSRGSLPASVRATAAWVRAQERRGAHPSISVFTTYRALHAPALSLHSEDVRRIVAGAVLRIVRGRNPETELRAATEEINRLFPSRSERVLAQASDAFLVRMLDDLAATRDFSGTVAATKGGRIVVARSYGLADRGRGRRTTRATRYLLNTLTPVFTWIGLLQLRDEGRLDLDRPVCAYLARCPASWRPLHVRHLMGGSSGLARLRASDFPSGPPTPAQYVDRLRRHRLTFRPGTIQASNATRFYSGPSPQILAARLLEIVSGEPWEESIRRSILVRAGMTSTSTAATAADAVGYGRTKRRGVVARPLSTPATRPDVVAGLWSTPVDMARLDLALSSGRLLSEQSLVELDTPTAERDRRRGRGWSCCWLVAESLGRPSQLHGGHGAGDGFYAAVQRYPDDRVAALSFTNVGGNGPAFAAAELVASRLLGMLPDPAYVDLESFRGFAGRYRNASYGLSLRVALVGRELRVTDTSPGWDDFAGLLVPLEDGSFVVGYSPARTLRFVHEQGRRTIALRWTRLWRPLMAMQLRRVGP